MGFNSAFKGLRTKLDLSHLKTQYVPRSQQSALVIKNDKLILYREIIAFFFLKSILKNM